MACGVYQLTSSSGNAYIGSSIRLEARIGWHKRQMIAGRHPNLGLQRAFDKYGLLTSKVLIICRPEDRLMYEQACITGLKPRYNRSGIAGAIEMTPEVCAKISAARKGHSPSQLTRDRIAAARTGTKAAPETRAKLSAMRKGITVISEAQKLQVSKRHKGKVISAETRAKLSALNAGRSWSSARRAAYNDRWKSGT